MTPPSDDEIREELNHHLAARAEHNAAQGLPPEEAQRQARLRFGNLAQIHELTRSVHRLMWLDDLRLDLTWALRSFRRNPVVPLTALLLLTLGIGSSTAVFTAIDRVLFRPLPYASPDQLVSFGLKAPLEKNEFMLHSDFYAWQRNAIPFSATGSTRGAVDCDITEGEPQRLRCGAVDTGMIPLLGVPLFRGANFTAAQDLPNGPRAVILGHALWRGRFGAREDILGKVIQLDGQPATVMGILPPNYSVPAIGPIDMLVPQQSSRGPAPNGPWLILRTFGRLKPGTSITQATEALKPQLASAMLLVPAAFRKDVRLEVQSLHQRQTADNQTMSWLLLGSVLAVFAIACANLTNLWIARNATRQNETAIRLAIGASRSRLVRHLLTESLLLSTIGAITGTAFAWLLLKGILVLAPTGLLTATDLTIDARVLAFTVMLSALAAFTTAIFPALQLPSVETLNSRHGHFSQPRLRLALVTVQIAVSLVLCTSAALLLRSLWTMQNTALGFETTNTLFVQVNLGRNGYPKPEQRTTFFNQLEAGIAALPSVSAVSVSDSLPPSGRQAAMIFANIEVEGRPRIREGTGGMVGFRVVSPNFFTTLSIPIREGRTFDKGDRSTVILNRLLASRLFGNTSPLGKKVRFVTDEPWHTVIGVCDSIQNSGYAPRDGEYYLLRTPDIDHRQANFVIRTQLAAATLDPWFQQLLHGLNPAIPARILPLSTRVEELAAKPRFETVLLSLFAITGLTLALLGLYSVIAFLVTQRTREMGIRLALGASPANILSLFIRQALHWSTAGITLGLGLSWLATGYLKTHLYQVSPRDPYTWAISVALLLTAALLAAWLPARRATRIAPSEALRS